MPQSDPKAGEFYRHFKNKNYQVICRAFDEESGQEQVIYQALYDDFKIYSRPLTSFISPVDYTKYPDATARWRFTLVENVAATTKITSQENVIVTTNAKETENVAVTSNAKETAESQVPRSAIDWMMEFLDTDDFEERYKILKVLEHDNELTDSIVDNLAAAIDVVIDDGPLGKRFDELKTCVRTRAKYESTRLRG